MSLNLAKVARADIVLKEWNRYPQIRDADIILLQEVCKRADGQPGVAEALAAALSRSVYFASPEPMPTTLGVAILSRYALGDYRIIVLPKRNLLVRSRSRSALFATAKTRLGAVRIVVTHLDTRENSGERVSQLSPILEEVAKFPGPVIIGGDLNTNDFLWLGAVLPVPAVGVQAESVKRLFAANGFTSPFARTGATFDHLGMRLDWIYSKRLRHVAGSIQPLEFSDHHAIRADFSLPVN